MEVPATRSDEEKKEVTEKREAEAEESRLAVGGYPQELLRQLVGNGSGGW